MMKTENFAKVVLRNNWFCLSLSFRVTTKKKNLIKIAKNGNIDSKHKSHYYMLLCITP